MGVLRPLILKNLIHVKRNIFKTILQLFYPCIIMIIMISFLSTNDKLIEMPEMNYSNFSSNINLADDNYSLLFDLFEKGDLALISKNEVISEKFKDQSILVIISNQKNTKIKQK